jgi:COP9 signalosome complex subunit 6
MMSNFRNMSVSSLCNRRNADDQIMSLVDSPVLLVFGADEASGLPLKVYEGARAGEDNIDKFAEVPYGIETGEAERIAVDGVSRGTDSDSAGKLGHSSQVPIADGIVVSNLTTQRNAIQMLHERITVLLQYVIGVVNSMSS